MKNILILAALLLTSCGDTKIVQIPPPNNEGGNNNEEGNNDIVWTIGQDKELAHSWSEGEVTDQYFATHPELGRHQLYGYLKIQPENSGWFGIHADLNADSPNYYHPFPGDYDPRDHFIDMWADGLVQYAELTFETDPDEGLITGYTFVVYWNDEIDYIGTFNDDQPFSSYISNAWAIHHDDL